MTVVVSIEDLEDSLNDMRTQICSGANPDGPSELLLTNRAIGECVHSHGHIEVVQVVQKLTEGSKLQKCDPLLQFYPIHQAFEVEVIAEQEKINIHCGGYELVNLTPLTPSRCSEVRFLQSPLEKYSPTLLRTHGIPALELPFEDPP
jgi:hypothetical protein